MPLSFSFFFFFLHFRMLINRQVVLNTSIENWIILSEIFCLFKLSVDRDIKDNTFWYFVLRKSVRNLLWLSTTCKSIIWLVKFSTVEFFFFETFPLLLSFTVHYAAKNRSWTYLEKSKNYINYLIVHNSTLQCLKIMNLKSFCMHLVSERTKRYLSETATHSRLIWDQRGKLK